MMVNACRTTSLLVIKPLIAVSSDVGFTSPDAGRAEIVPPAVEPSGAGRVVSGEEGGVLLIVGLQTRGTAILFAIEMVVAVLSTKDARLQTARARKRSELSVRIRVQHHPASGLRRPPVGEAKDKSAREAST
jgi:hypothetical protein